MKRLDKFVFANFLGPFVLTFFVVLFIFLVQLLVSYLQEFIGKDLGLDVFGRLIFFFSLNIVPMALPLSVLLASLIAYGNLGEHFELTAIKSSGISLLRTIQPVFLLVLGVSLGSFLFNNHVVPVANLKGYSLLYDIKQKKPALEFKEGLFYNGLPGYSIKVSKKYEDGITLGGIIIYDHTLGMGNTKVILADSGKMYSALSDRYLKLELYRGHFYNEAGETQNRYDGRELTRTAFATSEVLFSLASFDMNKTAEELFTHNRVMKNVSQLTTDVDSMRRMSASVQQTVERQIMPFYYYHLKPIVYTYQPGMYERFLTTYQSEAPRVVPQPYRIPMAATVLSVEQMSSQAKNHIPEPIPSEKESVLYARAANTARNIRGFLQSYSDRIENLQKEANAFEVEKYRKYTQSVAVFIMFLIGAPLGAIIKKGGLGVPVLMSIIFFILFYVITLLSEKYAKEGLIPMMYGMWAANAFLLPIGLFFLRQARNDSPLFDSDFYFTTIQRWSSRVFSKK